MGYSMEGALEWGSTYAYVQKVVHCESSSAQKGSGNYSNVLSSSPMHSECIRELICFENASNLSGPGRRDLLTEHVVVRSRQRGIS